MIDTKDATVQQRAQDYVSLIGNVLANKKRRECFAVYAFGLIGDGERKSVEPIAARACGDPQDADPAHQRLLHFVGESAWSDREVRRTAAQYAIAPMVKRQPVEAWIVDDTGFLKQGKHSVGVQRQYTGSAGKITNCQLGVSLGVATRTEHLPVDFELYLPHCWTDDPIRRREGQIPDHIGFRTKPQLAMAMIRRAIADGLPRGVVLADVAYGNSSRFRADLRAQNLDYAVGVEGSTKVWPVRGPKKRRGKAISVGELAMAMGIRSYRKVTWRQGSKEPLWSWFAACRVVVCHADGTPPARRREEWLLIEWLPDESAPTKFTLSTLPRKTPMRRLVRLVKERWRTERMYEDLKGELGLDHFEGRRFRGWHHHVSVALCCYAFLVAEQVRRFPPSTRRSQRNHAQRRAARAAFRGLIHHGSPAGRQGNRALAPAVPVVSPRADAISDPGLHPVAQTAVTPNLMQ